MSEETNILPGRIFFNEAKFPPNTLLVTQSRATYDAGLYAISVEGFYRGEPEGLESLRLRTGGSVPADVVEQIRRGNAAMFDQDDVILGMFISSPPQVEHVATNQEHTITVKNDNGSEVEIDIPRQELFRFSFDAVAAKRFEDLTWQNTFDVSVQSQVVRKSFSDSYNDVFRSTTDVGEVVSGGITRQISFDYLVREHTVTVYFTDMPPYDEFIRKILGTFEIEIVLDPDTGKEFLNYININNYVFESADMPVSNIPPKGDTLFIKSHTASYEIVAGGVLRYTVQLAGAWQRQGA
jgi:hypothetical protein